uniref:Replication-associated protein n=1 Tax=Red panda feces-associated genomovirus TaxID=2863991 RepID=A0A8K1HH17_9VIRU|nr:replication-associated protein [Red panda feces-associated genomovirus]
MQFRLNAKRVFLTYPQANEVQHHELHTHLSQFGNCYSCRELHSDGGVHYHAILTSPTKFNIRRSDFFDYNGRHPNMGPVKQLGACADYIGKGGDTLGTSPVTTTPSRSAQLTCLLIQHVPHEEFMQRYSEIDPFSYINNYDRIRSFSIHHSSSGECTEINRDRSSFKETPLMSQWVMANLFPQPERPKSLVLIGGTRLGKTEWARSLGTHNYWPNTITQDRIKGARYAVIDDMDTWDKFPYKKQFMGCHKEIGLCLKYSRPEKLTWGIPTIFLWNPEAVPYEVVNPGYYHDNCTIITINTPLFWLGLGLGFGSAWSV